MKKQHRFRSPNGVSSKKPVYVRLMPNELKQLEEIANSEIRALGAQARLFLINGMSQYLKQSKGL